ncbi:MAG: 6-phosphofructokinase [Wujia sp.]
MKTNCIVAQSGGPTAAINSSLAGVLLGVRESEKYKCIYGAIHGIQGVLSEQFLDLSEADNEFIQKLKTTPAMYLGSCRFKLPDMKAESSVYENIFQVFEKLDIGAFFYIGGNDSMDTVAKLAAYADSIGSDLKIAGVPKTIDNDLLITDHTPGYGSAAKYIASSIREIAYDTYIYNVQSVTIVEIMGRDAGWLTAASVLARTSFSEAPHLIYLPEKSFDEEQFLSDLKEQMEYHRNVIVAVSEGIQDSAGNYICAGKATADRFGHARLSGAGKYLELLVKKHLGVKVRSVEINVLQRCAAHMASRTDLDEGFELGYQAVKLTEKGQSGFMTTIVRDSDSPYQAHISSSPVGEVANKAKGVPLEWITSDGHDVTEELINYIKPLVIGEVRLSYEDGIVSYLNIGHLN